MLTVHLRINDAATGQPTPVRLHVAAVGGEQFAPLGRTIDFACGKGEDVGGHLRVGRERWAYIDGACEIRLPAGVPVRVRAAKGPEFDPLDEAVTLGPGQMALRFAVKRWSGLRDRGWVSGDTRAHFLPPHAAALEAAAEDLAVVNLLACEHRLPSPDGTAYPTTPNLLAFSGRRPALQTDAALVAVNTLNAHPVLGRVGLLHAHRPVFPLSFGGDDATDDGSVCDWCDQCHRKNGLAVWVRAAARSVAGPPGGEALAAFVLGKIDALEFDGRPGGATLPYYYALLGLGLPLPLVGGSGKDSNAVPLGSPRTYARLAPGEPLTYAGWIEAVRSGRCFATNGPLLTFTADGRGPGETLDPADSGVVRATAASGTPLDALEVVAGGAVVARAAARSENGRWVAAVEETVPLDGVPWLAARALGGSAGGPPAFAHTSPVYVRGGVPSPGSVALFAGQLRATREWVEEHGRFADERRKRHLLGLLDAALARLAP